MTREELRNKLIALRDAVRELNPHYIEFVDSPENEQAIETDLMDAYNQLHYCVENIPYNNIVAKIISKN